VLSTEVILSLVVAVAATCDATRSDSGLIAAIVMGVAIANLKGIEPPEDRPFFRTIVQLVIGLLFVSISATVTPTSLLDVLWPTIGLVACLVLIVRPVVAFVSTVRTDLPKNERAFVGWMDPRGIVAASTTASFAPQLASSGVEGADKLLPATFLVIVGNRRAVRADGGPRRPRARGLAGLRGRTRARVAWRRPPPQARRTATRHGHEAQKESP
jgi:NhaP-type Na+/H+ or K+/H+ antiporter